MTNVVDLHALRYPHPAGFFITENEEIVYCTGKEISSNDSIIHVEIIRMLETEGLTEQSERLDRLQPATRDDGIRFYNALSDYLRDQIKYHETKIRELRNIDFDWRERL